ncbi:MULTISPECIES: bacteriocin immunity protein [Enterococcus]|uniref:Bacteriocin immunity protein n=1 Tax=Enterococcus mundtii TaxID=53346 RepID=A0A2S7RUS0_ENTMU|nr:MULTISPECIES: bacteriocin immunity protein [Enterococcus]MDA9460712.1 putative piscicolin immunity protein [Enterococcus mundtii 3F]PQF23551.1 hypothetical protein CUS89_06520 [Enterococcus mundtii]PTO38382.1 bacteriocin immunity protein [Enterococcus mundtii]PTO44316.1 bacteriocin immunity protein [Enterococcus mundtii]
MSHLRWFSGGNDRRNRAETIINELIADLALDLGNESLREVLQAYLEKLQNDGASVPFILSRMNLDISNALKKAGVSLNEHQSEKLHELMAISSIRYGY